MARFFLPRTEIREDRATITGPELNHLRVLRLRSGDRVILFDDAGWEHEAIMGVVREGSCDIAIIRSYQIDNESSLKVILAVALTKGEKMDWVIEKATELGAHTIAPFVSKYTVPKLNENKAAQRSARWRAIAVNAAKQCGRVHIPQISPLTDFRDFVQAASPDALRLLFWEKEAQQGLAALKNSEETVGQVVLLIGPEGGFSSQEAALALEHGFKAVHFGSRILRAETAAVAALSAVQLLWGDLG